MGLHFTVVAGPVLVCKFHIVENVTTKVHNQKKCPKCNVNRARSESFCSICGTGLQEYQTTSENKTKKKSVADNIFDLMTEGGFREDVFSECWGGVNNEKLIADTDIYSPASEKFKKLLGRSIYFSANDFVIHLKNPDIQKEIRLCEEFFAAEIAFLRTNYDSVTVEWMVLVNGR